MAGDPSDRSRVPAYVIVELNPSGHRLFYVKVLTRCAESGGERVALLTLQSTLRSAQYAAQLGDIGDALVVHTMAGEQGAHRRILTRVRSLRRAYSIGKQYHGRVILPDGDVFIVPLLLLGLLRRRKRQLLTALLMRAPLTSRAVPHSTRFKGFGRALAIRLATRLSRVDLCLLAYADGSPPRVVGWFSSLPLVPDPLPPATNAPPPAVPVVVPHDRYIFLVAGAIDRRKGIPAIVGAWCDPATTAANPVLVLAGKRSSDLGEKTEQILDRLIRAGNVYECNRYLEEPEFAAVVDVADFVLVVRDGDEGPSGLFGRALRAGKPLIVAGDEAMGFAIRRLGNGIVTRPDAQSIASAVREACARRNSLTAAAAEAASAMTNVNSAFANRLLRGAVAVTGDRSKRDVAGRGLVAE